MSKGRTIWCQDLMEDQVASECNFYAHLRRGVPVDLWHGAFLWHVFSLRNSMFPPRPFPSQSALSSSQARLHSIQTSATCSGNDHDLLHVGRMNRFRDFPPNRNRRLLLPFRTIPLLSGTTPSPSAPQNPFVCAKIRS